MTARVLAVAALLLASGCASLPFVNRGAGEDREAELERRLIAIEKESTRSRIELERLRARVAELEAARTAPVTRPAAPPPPAPAAMSPAVPTAPAAPRESIEESELAEPEPAQPLATPAMPVSADASAAYEAALAKLQTGDAAGSESALTAFLAAHPGSELADNAWFWIGEARLVRQDVEGALAAFRTAVERYPDGNKTPDALFKLGHCLALQGQGGMAAEIWSELVRRFPETAAAERAREGLEGAGRAAP
ncbi:MAG: hypothetical protein AMXMBFR36_02130 [Acidobacteriota bacterium]